MRTVTATRYVTPLREGGSLPALVEADDDGLYVVKFRGAGQGPKALVAELVAGEIGAARSGSAGARARARRRSTPRSAAPSPTRRSRSCSQASAGHQLRARLPARRPPLRAGRRSGRPTPELAAAIVWFDALVDERRPHAAQPEPAGLARRLWLIDHGAALYAITPDCAAHTRAAVRAIRDHVLLPRAGSIADADARLAPLIDRELLAGGILRGAAGRRETTTPACTSTISSARLEAPRAFVEEAERARRA